MRNSPGCVLLGNSTLKPIEQARPSLLAIHSRLDSAAYVRYLVVTGETDR